MVFILQMAKNLPRAAWLSRIVPRQLGSPGSSVMIKKPLPANAGDTGDVVLILRFEDPLAEGMATYSSILSWRIPWTEEPGGI